MNVAVNGQNVGTGTVVSQGGNQVPDVTGTFDVDYVSNAESGSATGYTFAAVTSAQLSHGNRQRFADGWIRPRGQIQHFFANLASAWDARRR